MSIGAGAALCRLDWPTAFVIVSVIFAVMVVITIYVGRPRS